MTMVELSRKPSAWLPIALSLVALGMVLAYLATVGVTTRQAAPDDEGAPARIFQALMASTVLLIGYFAVRWLPTSPRVGIKVIAAQLVAAAIPIATIVWLESAIA